ncbi:MAG: deoxyribonuclease IV [Clostridia bacterium]|nr:deoxyribonuclease IV [Clostridia bacterium]
MRLGAHLSIAKGLPQAVKDAIEVGANTFAFFTRNPRGGAVRAMSDDEIRQWTVAREEADIFPIVGHLPYTINLASPKEEAREFGRQTLRDDLERAHRYGCEYLVMHPGSHGGDGVETGIERIVEGIAYALEAQGDTMLLLEGMSGQGTEIGGTFEELAEIMKRLGWPERVGVCLDTCHLYAAGYDIATEAGLADVLDRLERTVGLRRVRALHLNDSKFGLGSRKDRHAKLGEGEIGRAGLHTVLSHPFFRALPWELETPVDDWREYADHIRTAREIAAAG